MSQLAALLDDGAEDDAPQANQLALVVADAPLLPPSARLLSSDVRAGVKRRRGCGVCRACLFFPNRMACLATQTEAQLAAKAAVKRQTKSKRSQATALERQLDKQQQQAPGVPPRPGSAFVPQQACRLCKCADHTAVACPLQTCLSSAAPPATTWADALDPHMRAVLLAGAPHPPPSVLRRRLTRSRAAAQFNRSPRRACMPPAKESRAAAGLAV